MDDGTGQRSEAATRNGLVALGLVALAASAVFGANPFGVRDRLMGPDVVTPATSREQDDTATGAPEALDPTVRRSYPWWQTVQESEGVGDDTVQFTIADAAIQWRVGWSCDGGSFAVVSSFGDVAADESCATDGEAFGLGSGDGELMVSTGGSWQVTIQQQVDVPLHEPPLPEMADPGASVLATGAFHRIDEAVEGGLELHQLADGRWVVRLQDFWVHPNADLELRLSPLADPQTSEEFLAEESVEIGVLDVTAGELNFIVPDGIDPTEYRSLVIWCAPVFSAYAGAPLDWSAAS